MTKVKHQRPQKRRELGRKRRLTHEWKNALDAMELEDDFVMKRELAACAHVYLKRQGKDSMQVSLKNTNGKVRIWRIK